MAYLGHLWNMRSGVMIWSEEILNTAGFVEGSLWEGAADQ